MNTVTVIDNLQKKRLFECILSISLTIAKWNEYFPSFWDKNKTYLYNACEDIINVLHFSLRILLNSCHYAESPKIGSIELL